MNEEQIEEYVREIEDAAAGNIFLGEGLAQTVYAALRFTNAWRATHFRR